MRGKIQLNKRYDWLGDLARYKKEGWRLAGITKKDADGYYWFILEKV